MEYPHKTRKPVCLCARETKRDCGHTGDLTANTRNVIANELYFNYFLYYFVTIFLFLFLK